MRNLLTNPAWKPEDLGCPLPDSPHACSVCLPTWQSVIDYEEAEPELLAQLRAGYPRFLLNPLTKQLCEVAATELGLAREERVLVFPSQSAAQRAQAFMKAEGAAEGGLEAFRDIFALRLSEDSFASAFRYWRFSGEIVSSRQAEDLLTGSTPEVEKGLQEELASSLGFESRNCFLYESGMSGVFSLQQAILKICPGKKTLQLDFPYVDVLKVQEKFGPGAEFLPVSEGQKFEKILERVRSGEFAAVFCEIPSNPLLRTVDLEAVAEVCREGGTLLCVDDTVASHANVDVEPYADVITTSLTKWISGKGDITGGLVRIPESSAFGAELRQHLLEENPTQSRLYERDLKVLCSNSKDWRERMVRVNQNGEVLADLLKAHPKISHLWYPKYEASDAYDVVKVANGGFGGLMSFHLKDDQAAPKVYNALAWNKGPSLGSEFSLACPYTLLAHYYERQWSTQCGVPENLIRLSVGIEDTSILVESLQTALDQA